MSLDHAEITWPIVPPGAGRGNHPKIGETLPGNFGQDRGETLPERSFLSPEYWLFTDGAKIVPPSDESMPDG